MELQQLLSLICFILVGITGLIFAALYLFRGKFMPYHADALGRSWGELDAETRVLIMALMRVAGGGWLATTVAIALILNFSFLAGEAWASWAILLTGFSVVVPTIVATLLVRTRTKAHPPVLAAVLALVLLLTGCLLGIL
jgi:hypothetical protein